MCIFYMYIYCKLMDELPTGFRFYPTEEELISFYLHNKLQGVRDEDLERVIPVLDIYKLEPSDLPQYSGELCRGDPEQWFFFAPRQEREARGGRPNRTTASGYWKATGSPSYVLSSTPSSNNINGGVIGIKKTMVFYRGKAPNGTKTQWKMIEYKAIQGPPPTSTNAIPQLRHEFSLCRVYITTGRLRSFDRRPPVLPPQQELPVTVATSITAHGHGHHRRRHHEDGVYNNQSYNSSSAIDAGNQSASTTATDDVTNETHEEAGEWDVEEDIHLLWELERLEWL